MTSKRKGKQYVVVRENAHWVNDQPVKAGTKITLTKKRAETLLHRGIVEEA
jgi:hypothetical protein